MAEPLNFGKPAIWMLQNDVTTKLSNNLKTYF